MIEYHIKQTEVDRIYRAIDKIDYSADEYAPALEELKSIIGSKEPDKYVPFLMWIDDTGYDTPENITSRKIIRKYLTDFVFPK